MLSIINTEITAETDFPGGQIFLIDKPYQWTSFDVVKKIKCLVSNKFGYKKLKVGHAGTLDPLATGLVIVCIGKATKKVEELQGLNKEYIARFEIGKTTPSFDLETDFDKEYQTDHITKEYFEEKIKEFIGESDQVPPIFSAKNINGKRAYSYARKGQTVELKSQKIIIESIQTELFEMPDVVLKITCSKGTYIRAIARDLGIKLNSGGYLKELRRTAVGSFRIEKSMDLKEFEKKIQTICN